MVIVVLLASMLLAVPVLLPAQQEIKLEIYPSTDSRVVIGIDRFSAREPGEGLSREVSGLIQSVLEQDLDFSLYFQVLTETSMGFGGGTAGGSEGHSNVASWKDRGARYLVQGSIDDANGRMVIDMRILGLSTLQEIARREYTTSIESLRWTVHRMADDVIEILIGEKGVSRSAIAYISNRGDSKELYLMDFDGYNARPLTGDGSIVLSPAWSPEGDKIVFTSFQDDNPNLHLKDLKGDTDVPLLTFPGINSAPAWSPDSRYLAVTLSKDGASEIYRYDIRSSVLRRLTYNRSIDTSPSWSPNGKQIVFTSDRLGNPHIFVMDADGSNLRRLTNVHPFSSHGNRGSPSTSTRSIS
jgi:TolB protein